MTENRGQEGTAVIPGNLHVPEDCRAVSEVLARIGDKWTVLVVITLGEGDQALQRAAPGARQHLPAHADPDLEAP